MVVFVFVFVLVFCLHKSTAFFPNPPHSVLLIPLTCWRKQAFSIECATFWVWLFYRMCHILVVVFNLILYMRISAKLVNVARGLLRVILLQVYLIPNGVLPL